MNEPYLMSFVGGVPLGRTYRELCMELLQAPVIHTGEWQAMDTSKSKAHATRELEDVSLRYEIPLHIKALVNEVEPTMPWAEEHFAERVSGQPLNPAPSHERWPYAVRGNEDHLLPSMFKFDHTYPERFWPKYADAKMDSLLGLLNPQPRQGIRYVYGDLSDVVSLLARSPLTRQAYLPVWFPEDTGAVLNQRVPCTLGYHFMIRGGDHLQPDRLSCRYFIRSCDIYRHFRNDVYLACRLTQWIADQINRRWGDETEHIRRSARIIKPGHLTMHISSLHMLLGDTNKIEEIAHDRQA